MAFDPKTDAGQLVYEARALMEAADRERGPVEVVRMLRLAAELLKKAAAVMNH